MGQITRTKFGCVVSLNIPNAQVLTLHSVPLVVIPAKAGFIWVPTLMVIASDTTAAAYATAATFTLGNGVSTMNIAFTLAHSGLSSGAKDIAFAYNVAALNNTAQSSLANVAVTLTADADPTGGDPTNIVNIQVFYNVIPAVA